MTDQGTEQIPLSAKERELVRRIAERDGITEDQAATNLVKQELARRAGKRGRMARVLPLRRREKNLP